MLRDGVGYSNKGQTLEKVKLQDPKKLKLDILKKPYNKITGEYIVPLKSPFSAAELKLPIRNTGCYANALCYWNMDQLLIYLSQNMGYDEKKNLSYYCPNCMKHFENNKRYVQSLYLEKNLCMVLQMAKTYYINTVPEDLNCRNFKKGVLKFNKLGQIVYSFSNKTKVGTTFQEKTYNIKIKEQDVRLEKANTIEFDKTDENLNTQSLKMFQNYLSNTISSKISAMINFLKVVDTNLENKDNSIIKDVCGKIQDSMAKNIKLVNYTPETRNKIFTFAFSNNIHINNLNEDFSFLTTFYPQMKLWRKFFLEFDNGDPYIHPEGALYVKIDSKIYIIGGNIMRYVPNPNNLSQKKKAHNPITDTTIIDLSNVDPLKPTRIIQTEKKKKFIIVKKSSDGGIMSSTSSIKSKPSEDEKQKNKVIDQMYPNGIRVKKLAPIPESLSLSAGVYLDGNIYVFSGSRIDQKQTVLPSSYCYNLSSNKWSKIRDLPTPRRNHIAFVKDNLIYIIGGVLASETEQFLPPSTKKIEIYNPKTNQYTSKQLAENPYLLLTRAELFNYRAIPMKLYNDQYMFINGEKSVPFILNPNTLNYSIGKSQLALPNVANAWGGSNSSDIGIKLQQVFDQSPPYYNGNYYYLHYSVAQDKTRLIYGDYDGWNLAQEYDPATWSKSSQ